MKNAKVSENQRQKKQIYNLTHGPIMKTLAAFTIPMIGLNLLLSLNGFINAIWVGKLLGEAALAATSNGNLILHLISGMIFGLGMASSILVGHAIGAQDLNRAKQIVRTSFLVFSGLSILFAVIGFFFASQILSLLRTSPESFPLALSYVQAIFISIPVTNLLSLLMIILRGIGDTRTPFLFMLMITILDILLTPLLIQGIGPIPSLGVTGAAISMLIAQAIGLFFFLLVLYINRHPLRLTWKDIFYKRLDFFVFLDMITKGFPMALQMLITSLASLTLMGAANSYGLETAAAYGVMLQLWGYLQMPSIAIGGAVSSIAAQYIGENRFDKLAQITWVGVAYSFILTAGLVIILALFDHRTLQLFFAAHTPAFNIAIRINTISSWAFIFFGFTMVLFGTMRATGAVMAPVIMLAAALLLARTAFAYGGQYWIGVDAIWWSIPFGITLLLFMAISYYFYGNWHQLRFISGEVKTVVT